MFPEYSDSEDIELRCLFCEDVAGLYDNGTFIFPKGVGSSAGVCCGPCSRRMGITGTVDVCPFCLLPILGTAHQPPDEHIVVCDRCMEIFTRIGFD